MTVTLPVGAALGLRPFLMRLHLYAGLFAAPFILIAAFSGTLYVLTPPLENWVYRDALYTDGGGDPQPLSTQAEAARAAVGPDLRLHAVRPAPASGQTSRFLFADPTLGESQHRTIFVDPASLEVRGDLTTYGTSGVLPLRMQIDLFHRSLMLGDWGRLYSELAASWLWISVLGGVVMWSWRRGVAVPRLSQMRTPQRRARLHMLIGLWLGVGLIFLSATGLTWSQYAGGRIDALRNALGWITPSVSLSLDTEAPEATHSEHIDHAQHGMMAESASPQDWAQSLDAVAQVAVAGGLDSPYLELRLPRPDQAWLVREYDRSYPTQVDTVAVDPATLEITSRADFAGFPLIAKLVRWGIDIHMGEMFGTANRILMAVIGLGVSLMIGYGYAIWWRKRPPAGSPVQTLTRSWARMTPGARVAAVAVAMALGWALPVMGASLAAFVVIDLLRWQMAG